MRSKKFGVRGFKNNRNAYIVWEYDGDCAVNEYLAYERGDKFILYPNRKLIPSSLELEKKTIRLDEAAREF